MNLKYVAPRQNPRPHWLHDKFEKYEGLKVTKNITWYSRHPVHFIKLNGAMRRILVPNISATFHTPRKKFVHDLKVSGAGHQAAAVSLFQPANPVTPKQQHISEK